MGFNQKWAYFLCGIEDGLTVQEIVRAAERQHAVCGRKTTVFLRLANGKPEAVLLSFGKIPPIPRLGVEYVPAVDYLESWRARCQN